MELININNTIIINRNESLHIITYVNIDMLFGMNSS